MNKEHYNQIIDWTIQQEQLEDKRNTLEAARLIFKNMGIPLPNGTMEEAATVLTTNDYMGWRKCTAKEAQTCANDGTAAMAVKGNEIYIVKAESDGKDEVATVHSADNDTVSIPSQLADQEDVQFYSYSAATTHYPIDNSVLVINKPYDPFYPYYNIKTQEQYDQVLGTYDYELRNEVIFDFTSSEIAAFRDKLDSLYYSTMDEQKSIWSSMLDLIIDGLGYVPKVSSLISGFSTGATLFEIGKTNNKENYHNLLGVIYDVLHHDNHTAKDSSYLYSVSLLQPSPYGGWELKFRCDSDGEERIFQLNEAVYHLVFVAATAHGNARVIYKIVPQYSYNWE